MNDYFNIGQIVAITGTSGEIVLKHSLGKKSSLKGLNVIFLEEKKGSFIPYFIHQTKAKNEEEIIIKLEDINTRESAKICLKKEVYITEDWFRKLTANDSPLSLLGFTVRQVNKEELGIIEEIIEMPAQVLAKINYKGKELLLPLNEHTLVSIHRKKKIAELQLPEGLLDIYLTLK